MAKAAPVGQAKTSETTHDGGLTGHGGRLDVADSLYPGGPRPWLDLSTGINPRPWQPCAPLSVDLASLPSLSSLRALEKAAAAFFDADPALVVTLPGSEVGLRLLAHIGPPAPIVRIGPGYATHGVVAQTMLPTEALESASASGTILLANPNNPDGRLLSAERLLADRRGWLVVDEAFADCDPAISVVPSLDEQARVIVLRSFGKFFGLAGLRLGFAIAPADICARLRALLGDWPVSAQAIAYGTAAYSDDAWIADTRRDLADRAGRLNRLLARHGLQPSGACPLFRLVEHPEAGSIFDRLARAGILTRPFDHDPTWLRFGLPADDAAFARLDHALTDG